MKNVLPDLPRLFAHRADLASQGTTIYRAAHTTETEGLFAVDVAGSAGVLSLYEALSPQQELELARACAQAGHLSGVYVKRRPVEAKHLANTQRDHLSPPEPLWGEATPDITALEHGVPFLIRPGADLSIGLFTDARPARAWVQQHAPASVLNTFAYTCGFGLNAALGGANVVKNVDLSRKVLSWGQENYALSRLRAPDTDFLYGDVFQWLHRLHKRRDQFQLVILDPPSFARSSTGTWRADRDYARLAAQAAAVTAPGGQILALLNHAGVNAATFERLFQRGLDAARRNARVTERLHPGHDYPQAHHLKIHVWHLQD